MKRSHAIFLLFLLSLGTLPSFARAQTQEKYLTAAHFVLSVDDWADIWINGHHVIEQQAYTPFKEGSHTIPCLPEHLCYFTRQNTIAIEVADTANPPNFEDDYAGIAYVLQMTFSDGSHQIISSSEVDRHSCFYVGDRFQGDPAGWQAPGFDDSAWPKAQTSGQPIPNAALVEDPSTGGNLPFLSASGPSGKVAKPGERHLFRRYFFVNLAPNPKCPVVPTPTISANWPPAKVRPDARGTQPTQAQMAPTVAPQNLPPVSLPAAQPGSLIPSRASAPTLPRPSATPWARPTAVLNRNALQPTPTPTWGFVPREVAEPIRSKREVPVQIKPTPTPTALPRIVLRPTPTPTPRAEDASANIFLHYADGPGLYRLEVFDLSGKRVRLIFEKRITFSSEEWVQWDGKDESGQEAPMGSYVIVVSREANVLQKINVVKSHEGP